MKQIFLSKQIIFFIVFIVTTFIFFFYFVSLVMNMMNKDARVQAEIRLLSEFHYNYFFEHNIDWSDYVYSLENSNPTIKESYYFLNCKKILKRSNNNELLLKYDK
jgi:hypothetical protein